MANRNTNPVSHPKNQVQIVTIRLQGNGAAVLTTDEPSGASDVASISRGGVGNHTLTLRHSYPELKAAHVTVRSATAGLVGRISAINVLTKTITVRSELSSTLAATDLGASDEMDITLVVRNSDA